MDSRSARISELPDFESLYIVLFLAFAIAIIVWILLRMLEVQGERSQAEQECLAKPNANLPKPSDEKVVSMDTVESESEDEFQVASREDAAGLFSTELSSGAVNQDPLYGIVFTEPPEERDNLKEIKGVGKVLEGKLHGIGVYRYKQVAVWTDAACEEFSRLLTFKNRIYRDNWIAQAKKLHREKYGEEL